MSQPKALAFALVLLLSACASGGGGPRNTAAGPKSKNQQAAELQVKLGRGYMDQGQFETAFQKLEKALKLDPNSVDANTMMAVLYERIDRAKLSEKHYRRAVELDPDDGSTNNNLGAYLCRLERYEEADAHFRKALDDPFYATPAAAAANAGLCASRARRRRRPSGRSMFGRCNC